MEEVQSPYFPKLVTGKARRTLRGEEITGDRMDYRMAGDEVASLYHYLFKSIPEFIYKKCRRGSGQSGMGMEGCEAFRNFAINPTAWDSYRTEHDDTVWTYLKEKIPWYNHFDEDIQGVSCPNPEDLLFPHD